MLLIMVGRHRKKRDVVQLSTASQHRTSFASSLAIYTHTQTKWFCFRCSTKQIHLKFVSILSSSYVLPRVRRDY